MLIACLLLFSCSDFSRTDPDELELAWVGEGSSSGFEASSSSSVSSSSATTTVETNSQNCTYSGGSPYGTLICSEKTYKTIIISSASSSLTLMAENLNIGTMVPGSASRANQSNDALIEKYCYSDTEANCTTDGGLYQWSEAMGLAGTCNSATCAAQISTGHHQGICPVGWHIPKKAEWDLLATMLGGSSVAGQKMKLNTTGYSSWDASTDNDGNTSGFSALPAGFRSVGGGFGERGRYAHFWEASENNASSAYSRGLYYGSADLYADLYADHNGKSDGFSVRCFRDF